jgi:quercetin dioxygenase-like cupin family protein
MLPATPWNGGRDVNTDDAEAPKAEDARQQAERVGAAVIELNCASAVATLRAGDSYRRADHSAETVAKQSGLRLVLVALRSGGRLDQHHADAPIVVHCLEGLVRFDVAGQSHELTPGHVLVIAAGLPHSAHATEQSAFLLTIGGSHPHREA